MKRILIIAAAAMAIVACGQDPQEKDISLVNDFYEHVLGNKPMTDDYLQKTLSEDILNAIWEADYEQTYSFWVFRTGCQDGPSAKSSIESIDPLGEGWYRVSYSDMGNPGVTDVKVEEGKISAYKSQDKGEKILAAVYDYMRKIGQDYAPAEYCIPYATVVAKDDSNPADIEVWGDFEVENYNLEGETLKFVSGGSHPGLMHVSKADDSTYSVTAFDAVGDGSSFDPTAKKIFGDLYESFMGLLSNDAVKKADREAAITSFIDAHNLPAKYYQDYGWDPVKIN